MTIYLQSGYSRDFHLYWKANKMCIELVLKKCAEKV